jgi:hypothetical protein
VSPVHGAWSHVARRAAIADGVAFFRAVYLDLRDTIGLDIETFDALGFGEPQRRPPSGRPSLFASRRISRSGNTSGGP